MAIVTTRIVATRRDKENENGLKTVPKTVTSGMLALGAFIDDSAVDQEVLFGTGTP